MCDVIRTLYNVPMEKRVRLEVHVPGLREGESVRVSGNVAELGEWNVHRSKPLSKRDGGASVWYTDLSVSDSVVDYRYLIVQSLKTGEHLGLRIVRRETFLTPRRLTLSQCNGQTDDTDSHTPVMIKDDGRFGFSDEGEQAEDGGWLVGTSELQLRLQDSGKMHPVRIDTLSHDTVFSVLITPMKYCSKDEEVCRVAEHLPMEVKVLHRESGDCEFKSQGEYGQTFSPNQVLVFWTQALDFTYLAFTVDIYSLEEGGNRAQVGRTSILPQHLQDLSGHLVLTVLSPHLLPVGTITLYYLIVNPARDCPRAIHRTRQSFAHYWKKHKRSLDIGHRGLGDSYHGPEELKPSAAENTIASLKRAGAHGADYVEFDVQLTRDLVPVVYHDFTVCTTLARRGLLLGELYEVYVKDLSLRQLHHLQLDHSSALSNTPSKDPTPYASDAELSPSSEGEFPYQLQAKRHSLSVAMAEEEGPERRTFPTLEQVFRSLPPHIGFNIEVKYPVPLCETDHYNFPYFERNMMADHILRVIYRLARHRKIILSCFDADMCTILRRKQPKYPVVFLSTALSPRYSLPKDVRSRSFRDCMMHANAEKLLGVNVCSDIVLQQPKLVAQAGKSNLVVFTWGLLNNEYGNILAQRRMGVHAIIYDRITSLIAPQKNVFADEVDGEEEEEVEDGSQTDIKLPLATLTSLCLNN